MLECVECGRAAESFQLGWSAFYVADPDEGGEPALVTYCAECLKREFGGLLLWMTTTRQSSPTETA